MMDGKKKVEDGMITAGKGIAWFGAIMVGFREIGKAAGHAADSFRKWWDSRKPDVLVTKQKSGWGPFKKFGVWNETKNRWEE